jgi:hypothetical protein
MDCQSDVRLKALISLISQEATWIRRALPRAVPQSGQRQDGQESQTLWRYRNIPSVSIGTWHANVESSCAHAKPVGAVGVRST